jgi:hypothetical protein
VETHRLAPRWPEGCRKSWFYHSRFAKRSAFKQIPVCYRLFLHWEFTRHS